MILVVLAIGSRRSGALAASVSPVAGLTTAYAAASTEGAAARASDAGRRTRAARTARRRNTRRSYPRGARITARGGSAGGVERAPEGLAQLLRGPPRALGEDDRAARGHQRAGGAAAEGRARGPRGARPGRPPPGSGRPGAASARAAPPCAPGRWRPPRRPGDERPEPSTLGAPHSATRRATSSCHRPPRRQGQVLQLGRARVGGAHQREQPASPGAAASMNGATASPPSDGLMVSASIGARRKAAA